MEFSLRLIRSFRFAFEGAAYLLRTQPNARLHLLAGIAVVLVCAFLKLTSVEWALIALAIAIVWMAEAFNTAVETLANRVTIEREPQIKIVKDVAATATLFAATGGCDCGNIDPRRQDRVSLP